MSFRRTRIASLLACACVAGTLSGCSAPQITALRQREVQAKQAYTATTQAAADVKTQVDSLPDGDPVKAALSDKLAKLNATAAAAQKYLDAADAAIAAADSAGKFDPNDPGLRDAAALVPYGPQALAVVALGWGLVNQFRRRSADTALTQVVRSVETALPAKTDVVKATMASVQGPVVSAMVEAIKRRENL